LELKAAEASRYVAECFHWEPQWIRATELGGGVSNHVVLIETPAQRFVLKQSLPKLRVEADWFSDRERIFRESRSLARLGTLLPAGSVPRVLFEDRENFAYAMSAAPEGSVPWKDLLLGGEVSFAVAESVAKLQAEMIGISYQRADWQRDFGDLTVFEQLRLHPYYQFTAERYPDLAEHFARALDICRHSPCSLVHGDWSPKNMMVYGESVMLIDFEVVHYGHPSFDTAFLLNHLLLKSFHRPGSAAEYREAANKYWAALGMDWLAEPTLAQLPCLLLARVDGKSPAEYIRDKKSVRDFARELMERPPACVDEVFARIALCP